MRTIWQFKLNRHDDPAPDPAPDPAGGKPADGKLPQFTGDFDPERAQRALASAREAEKAAKQQAQEALAKQQAQEQQLAAVLKALGKNPDGSDAPLNPEALVAEERERREHAEALAFQNGVKFNVHQAAVELGGDAARLLDSMSFIDSLDDLVEAGTDPGSAEFAAAVKAKVAAALESNPAYKVTGPAGPRPDPGQGTRPPVVTDFKDADRETFATELRKYGLRPRTY